MIEVIDLSDDDDEPIAPLEKTLPSATKQPAKKCSSPEPGPSGLCNQGKSPTEITSSTKDCSKNEEALKMLTKGIFDLKPGDADVPKVVASFKKKFMKCSQAFRESNECFDFLSDCYAIIQNNPVEIWSNVKQFTAKMTEFCNWKPPRSKSEEEEDEEVDDETSKRNRKIEMRLLKLHTSLKECQKKIKKLDETEVDWEQDENSSFMQKRRYEERAVTIYKKIAELEGKLSGNAGEKLAERHPKICTVGCDGLYQVQINSAVDKFVNRKFKMEEICFPNFREIKQIVASTNKEKSLGMTSEQVTQYSIQSLSTIGKKIKECRERNFSNNLMTNLNGSNFEDPAKADPELERKLKENKKIAEARVTAVMEHFTKQSLAINENEEALNSDDEMPPENDENDESPHQSGDEEDYITLEDDESTEETNNLNMVSVASVGNTVSSEVPVVASPLKTERGPASKPSSAKLAETSIPVHETEDQAVPNVSVEANGALSVPKIEADFKDDVEMWSDIEAELTNDGNGISDEERALLSDVDESAVSNTVCTAAECPLQLKKPRLEQTEATTEDLQATENHSLDGSFNPIIVGVESQVSGFSQEEPIGVAACTPPETIEEPRIATSPGILKLEQPDSAVQHSITNIIPVRKAQKARKSFTTPKPSANISDDCIVLD